MEWDQPNIIRMTGSVRAREEEREQKNLQKPKPPLRAALASWVELLSFQAGGGHFYEDVRATFSPIESKRNNAKILPRHILNSLGVNRFRFSDLEGHAAKWRERRGLPAA